MGKKLNLTDEERRERRLQQNREANRKWSEKNREKLRERNRKWRERNPEYSREKGRKWREKNPGKNREACRKYREENPEKFREAERKYREKNRERYREKKRDYQRKRLNNDPLYKAIHNCRSRRRDVLKRLKTDIAEGKAFRSSKNFTRLLGCPPSVFKAHMESQFTEGMTWENHGEWHYDHIRPLASFDHTDPLWEEQAWHYTNIRPLWAEDNFSKGSEWEGVRHQYGDGEPSPPPERPTLPFEE
jgi:hypothetical protein